MTISYGWEKQEHSETEVTWVVYCNRHDDLGGPTTKEELTSCASQEDAERVIEDLYEMAAKPYKEAATQRPSGPRF